MATSGYWMATVKLVETALSCSEMYGMMPITAMIVTSPPSSVLLP